MSDPNELRAIGERLLMLAEGGTLESMSFPELEELGPDRGIDERYLAGLARSLYTSRRLRDRDLAKDLFGEPAWDMLLDLFVRGVQGKKTTVSSLCIASGVPPTTALRWIGTLHETGFITREESDQDHRVVYVTLSMEGFRAMRRYLIKAARHLRPTHPFFLLPDEGES